jgi:hypothetical protein
MLPRLVMSGLHSRYTGHADMVAYGNFARTRFITKPIAKSMTIKACGQDLATMGAKKLFPAYVEDHRQGRLIPTSGPLNSPILLYVENVVRCNEAQRYQVPCDVDINFRFKY